MTVDWKRVAARLASIAARPDVFNEGQRATTTWLAATLGTQGAVLADEVGSGKTRIACAVAEAVLTEGGRVAVVVPPGLMHQWAQEWRALAPACEAITPRRFGTFTSFVRDIVAESERRHGAVPHDRVLEAAIDSGLPRPDEPELWLLSQGLRASGVRVAGERYAQQSWKLALGTLALAKSLRDSPTGQDAPRGLPSRRIMQTLSERRDGACWRVVEAMAERLSATLKSSDPLFEKLGSQPHLRLRAGADNRLLAESFRRGGAAKHTFEQLLGRLLGPFDLVVIDEAHKSRGVVGEEADGAPRGSAANVLTNLLETILLLAADGRRLGLTATPLELSGDDWEPLLRRALRGPRGFDHAEEAARGAHAARVFHDAARDVRKVLHHDDAPALPPSEVDALCAAAEQMTRTLRPHVTRRRRGDDPFLIAFHQRLRARHPHLSVATQRAYRHILPAVIEIGDDDGGAAPSESRRLWARALFAMESIGQALRGYLHRASDESSEQALSRLYATAYTRLSAGHLVSGGREELATLLAQHAPSHKHASERQRARIAYWLAEHDRALSELSALEQRAYGDRGDPLWSHPRVRAAIALVESFTERGEKVLVFGTYRAPMRALAQALEVRHALRSLAAARPVPVALGASAPLAWRELCHMRRGGFDGDQKLGTSPAHLQARWERARTAYKNLYDRVGGRVRKALPGWLDALEVNLEGFDEADRGTLTRIAIPFIVDMLLYDTETKASGLSEPARIHAAWTTLWKDTIEPLLEEESERENAPDDRGRATLLGEALQRLDGDTGKSHDTHYVRELHGQTDLTTRHLLQARFNRRAAAPHVLIAQSRVGREGLNLHKACRVVVQFNAEWNPAILDQQIGRVDRIGSLWQRLAQQWLDSNDPAAEPPFIEVRQLIFAGTYDAFQWDAVHSRQHLFDATLYGELLPAEKLALLDEATRMRLANAAPDFRPTAARVRFPRPGRLPRPKQRGTSRR